MKQYPSIQHDIIYDYAYVFDKIDGSNIRIEFKSKNGFYKFGTRNQLMDENTPIFGEAKTLFLDSMSTTYKQRLKDLSIQECVLFFEFFGDNSFAGNHYPEKHYLKLIDVNVKNKGIINPKEFISSFQDLGIASYLGYLNVNKSFINQVKDSSFPGISFEGVVCKYPVKNKCPPKMCKIKTHKWIDKLKNFCKEDVNLFEKLK